MSENLPEAVPTEDVALADDPYDLMLDRGRARLRRRMSTMNPVAFSGDEEMQRLYEDVLAQMLLEAEAVPGFGTMQDLAIEAYAFLWVRHKVVMSRTVNDPDLGEILDFETYEKLIQRFTQLFQHIGKSRNEAAAEEGFKREFIQQVLRLVENALVDEVADRNVQIAVRANLVRRLRGLIESGA